MKYITVFCLLVVAPISMADNFPEERFIDEIDETTLQRGENVARVTFADKYVSVTHEDEVEEDVIRNLPVVSGDILETRNRSYAEVEFIDGSLIQIDDRSAVEFQAINETYANESLSVIKLHKGSVFLHVTEQDTEAEYRVFRIDTFAGSTYIEAAGIYRVDLSAGRMKLKVYRGFGELSGENGSVAVHSGEFAAIRNMNRPGNVSTFNSFRGDDFEHWAYERRPIVKSVSGNYVDADIAPYSRDLDDHGEWRYNDEIDVHVWYPRVTNTWRPYYRGYWSNVGSALTWISYDSFGWVTHHYGRWGWSGRYGWYWAPGRYYSPAWVAWSSYDSYVGWCPLGYSNRPYYYNRNRLGSVYVNNNHYYWNYVNASAIAERRRTYTHRRINQRGVRYVTTRTIHVNRSDFQNSRNITKIIREPQLNRQRAAARTQVSRGTLVAERGRGHRAERVVIKSRDTGTVAVSRHSLRSTGNTGERASGYNASRTYSQRQNRAANGKIDSRGSSTTRRYNSTSQSGTSSSRRSVDRSRSSRGSDSSEASSSTKQPSRDYRAPSNRSGSGERSNRSTATRAPATSKDSSSRSNVTRSRNHSSSSNAAPARRTPTRSSTARPTRSSTTRSNATRPTRSNTTRSNRSSSGTKARPTRSAPKSTPTRTAPARSSSKGSTTARPSRSGTSRPAAKSNRRSTSKPKSSTTTRKKQ